MSQWQFAIISENFGFRFLWDDNGCRNCCRLGQRICVFWNARDPHPTRFIPRQERVPLCKNTTVCLKWHEGQTVPKAS